MHGDGDNDRSFECGYDLNWCVSHSQMMSLQDDDQDDNSADRLVIDEGIHSHNPVGGGGLLGNTALGVVHGNYSALLTYTHTHTHITLAEPKYDH